MYISKQFLPLLTGLTVLTGLKAPTGYTVLTGSTGYTVLTVLTDYILVYFFILNFVSTLITGISTICPPLPPPRPVNCVTPVLPVFVTIHFQQKKIFNVTLNYYFYFESCVQNVKSL